MSVRVMTWVWEHSETRELDRLVLLAIADHCDHDGTNAYPRMGMLAKKVRADERSVRRSVRRLLKSGELEVEERAGRQMGADNPRHRPHLFRIPMTGPNARSDEASRPDPTPGQVTGPNARSEREVDRALTTVRPDPTPGQNGNHAAYLDLTVLEPSFAADAAGAIPNGNGSAGPKPQRRTVVAKPTDDPVKGAAHRLAVLAHEQPVRPVTRGGFPAVMARLEQALRGGYSERDLTRAIRAGPVTWTADGLTTAVSKSRPAHSTASTAIRMIREGRSR